MAEIRKPDTGPCRPRIKSIGRVTVGSVAPTRKSRYHSTRARAVAFFEPTIGPRTRIVQLVAVGDLSSAVVSFAFISKRPLGQPSLVTDGIADCRPARLINVRHECEGPRRRPWADAIIFGRGYISYDASRATRLWRRLSGDIFDEPIVYRREAVCSSLPPSHVRTVLPIRSIHATGRIRRTDVRRA